MTVAEELRALRDRYGVSIRELAARARVSPSTVWRIEAGQVNPTIGMVERLRAAVGASPAAPNTREAAVSLVLGRLTAATLLRDPLPVLRRAQARVERLLDDPTLARGTRRWLSEWQALLDGPVEEVVAALIDPSERGYELRQSTPFTGVLSDEERLAAVGKATREHRASRSA